MAGLLLYEGYSGLWICLDKSEYALIIPQFAGIWLNSAEYAGHCQTFKIESFAKE